MSDDIRTRALKLYRPPFRHEHGYIWDNNNEMVLDQADLVETSWRIRGWGRISYLKDPEQLQDAVAALVGEALHLPTGDEIAKLLTEFWTTQLKAATDQEGSGT